MEHSRCQKKRKSQNVLFFQEGISIDSSSSPITPTLSGPKLEKFDTSPPQVENDTSMSRTSNDSLDMSTRNLPKENIKRTWIENDTVTPESLQVTKKQTLIDKSLSSSPNIQNTQSSQTSDQDSTGNEKTSKPFWNIYSEDLSRRLWLCGKTDCVDLPMNSWNGFARKTVQKSWFSVETTRKIQPTTSPESKNSLKISFPSLTSSSHATTVGVHDFIKSEKDKLKKHNLTQAKRGRAKNKAHEKELGYKARMIRLLPDRQQRDLLNNWMGTYRFTYNACVARYRELKDQTGMIKEFDENDKPVYYSPGDVQKLLRQELIVKKESNVLINKPIKRHDGTMNEGPHEWLWDCPEAIRDAATDQLKSALKSAISNLEEGNITDFSFKFKSKNKMRLQMIPIRDRCWKKLSQKTLDKYIKEQWLEREAKHRELKSKQNNRKTPRKRWQKRKSDTYWDNKKNNDKFVNASVPFLKSWNCKPLCSTEPLPETFTNDTKIIKTRDNKFYVIVLDPVEEKPKNPEKIEFASMDPGEKIFQVLYDSFGNVIKFAEGETRSASDENVRDGVLYKACKRLDELRSQLDKAKTSKEKYRLRQSLIKQRARIRNLKLDLHRKVAKFICENYNMVLLPEFNISNMVKKDQRNIKSKTVRNMLTLSHYSFKNLLRAKVREYSDTEVIIVNESFTTKVCTRCGHVKNGKVCGSDRIFKCNQCNLQIDRDCNGSRNIMLKYFSDSCMLGEWKPSLKPLYKKKEKKKKSEDSESTPVQCKTKNDNSKSVQKVVYL